MITEEGTRALQEIVIGIVNSVSAVTVIPCNINGIPLAVLHLDIVPHMGLSIIRIEVSYDLHTGDTQTVTDELEALGIALAYRTGFNK